MTTYLRKQANFNSFENDIQTSKDDLIETLNSADSRLVKNKAIFYGNYSIFGGVYQETNSTANEPEFFAVEFVGYNDIDVNGELKTFIGIVATPIEYNKSENGEYEFKLKEKRYTSVLQFTDGIQNAMSSLKENVTVEGLSLKYKANCFENAIKAA